MDRRDFQYFSKLYETRSVTKAAEDLHLARQSLSGSIAKLERMLGVSLFTRSKNGVEPTHAAEVLYAFTQREAIEYRKIQRDLEETLSSIKNSASRQRVVFGATWTMTPSEAIELIVGLQYKPDADISIEFAETTACVGWHDVRDNLVDVAFTRKTPPATEAKLEWALAVPSRACVLVSADDPLSRSGEIDFFTDLGGRSCLCPYEEILEELTLYLRKSSVSVRPIPANFTIIGSVIVGEGAVCVLPEAVARRIASHFDGRIIAIPCPNYPLSTDGFLMYRANAPEHVKKFVEDAGSVIRKALLPQQD